MQRARVFYSSAEIHSAIKQLFGHPDSDDRRVALVAYVGADALSYLPHPEGLHVICSPSAGGTNPDVLRTLLKRDAKVEFSDRLHMKVYWSRKRGCIITSANASSNALGVGNLKEAGVFLSPGVVRIDRLIAYGKPRSVRGIDLRLLDKESKARKFWSMTGSGRAKTRGFDFLEWHSSRYRSDWKLEWIEKFVEGTPRSARAQTLVEYGRREPHDFQTAAKGAIMPYDWILDFFVTSDGRVTSIDWLYVDFLVKTNPSDGHFYRAKEPYLAIQVHEPKRCPEPPFRLSPNFRRAFRCAIENYTLSRIIRSISKRPTKRLLDLIAREMRPSA